VRAHSFSSLLVLLTAGGQRNGIFLEYTQKNNGADVIVSYCKEHGKRWGKKRGVKSR
jgi:hypothetical protein